MRRIGFANNEYFHIFNRGIEKRDVFLDANDFERFLEATYLLNDKQGGLMIEWRDYKKGNPKAKLKDFLKRSFRKKDPLVEIIAYCLNPNHYHFILKQVADRGIERFMHKLGTSHTKYFNKKNKRSGVLFQGVFKSVHIDSNDYLLYLSAYVNKNNFIHGGGKNWQYSSMLDYLGIGESKLVMSKNVVLDQFSNIEEYRKFLDANALYLREKKELEKYLIEE